MDFVFEQGGSLGNMRGLGWISGRNAVPGVGTGSVGIDLAGWTGTRSLTDRDREAEAWVKSEMSKQLFLLCRPNPFSGR